MKIKECYITNFGILRDKKILFNDKLNSYFKKNGSGKSTLAAFVRAMLYGLSNSTIKNTEREHYYPYNSKLEFGGYLILTDNKNEYKIERYFAKTKKDDTLKVYFNNKLNEEIIDPGNQLLKLDEESFLRTMFIYPEDLKIESSNQINALLGNYVAKTEEKFDLKDLTKRLSAYSKKIKNTKKKPGKIDEIDIEIQNIKDEIKNLESIKISLNEKYNNVSKLELKKKNYEKIYEDSARVNILLDNYEKLNLLDNKIKDLKLNINQIDAKYNNGFILDDEKVEIKNYIKLEINLKDKIKDLEAKEDKINKELSIYNINFKENLPNQEKLDEITLNISDYNKLQNFNNNLDIKDKELIDKYKLKSNLNNDILSLDKEYSDYEKLMKNSNKDIYAPFRITDLDSNKKVSIGLASLAFLLILIGFFLGVFKNSMLYFIAVLGFILLIVTFFLYSLNKDKIKSNGLDSSITKINTILMPYGFSSESAGNVHTAIVLFKQEVEKFKEALDKEKEIKTNNEENNKKMNEYNIKLEKVFKTYNISVINRNYTDANIKLNKAVNDYKKLVIDVNENNKVKSEYNSTYKEIINKLNVFKEKYNILEDLNFYLDKESNDKIKIELLKKNLSDEEKNRINFVKEKKLTNKPLNIEKVNLTKLSEDMANVSGKLEKAYQEIENDQVEIDKLEYKQSKLDILKEDKKTLEYKKKIVDNTKDILAEAEESIKQKYIAPMKNSFEKYIVILEKALGKDIVMDSNFNLKYIIDGKERSVVHLSSGELSLCVFAYRLALLENIFKNEKHFIILDDLFVNLDDEHLKKAKEFVKKLSDDWQLLYFTCHESRII